MELIHVKGDFFEIPELNYIFSMEDDLSAVELYFKERKRTCFFNHDGRIYAKVKNFVFLLPFPYGIYELNEVFYDECYGGIDVFNGIVVDIGAFIGDTSIYFASKGAKEVIAYEPLPHICEIANTNVLINKFENVIHINNEAVGDRYGKIVIYETKRPGGSSVFIFPENEVISIRKVKVIPLSDVLFNLGRVDLLKIDCEGCEHAALKEAYKKEALNNVKNIIIEVHGNPNSIIKLLNKSSYKIIKKQAHSPLLHLIYACRR